MASKLDNVAGIFKNVKSRTIFLGTIFLIVLGLVIALGSLSGGSEDEAASNTRLPSAPGITGNPDVLGERDVSQQRARLTKIADDKAIWQAAAAGGSALPTAKGQKTDTVATPYNQKPLTEAEKQLEALVTGVQNPNSGQVQGQTQGSAQAGNQPGLTELERRRRANEAMQLDTQQQDALIDAAQSKLQSQIYTDSANNNSGGAQGGLAGAMASEVKQLLSSWAPTTQQYVATGAEQAMQAGENGDGTSGNTSNQTGAGASPTQPGASTPTAQDTAPPLLKAGSIQFAVLQTSVNTDEPGPIMATIETGQFRGAKLLGSIQKAGKYANGVALKFNTMTLPQYKSSLSINAFAIDPDTARTALASDTNHHYMLRYGSLFASSFLSGLGDAIAQSGQTTVNTALGGNTQFYQNLNTSDQLLYALGNVGTEMGDEVDQYFDRPTTIRIYSGTGIGILYMTDVKRPTPDQLMR